MIDEPIAGFWLVLASKLSSAGKALARSVAANQVPIGPSCGLDGLVGQVFRPQQRTEDEAIKDCRDRAGWEIRRGRGPTDTKSGASLEALLIRGPNSSEISVIPVSLHRVAGETRMNERQQGFSIGARRQVIVGRTCPVVARAGGGTPTPDRRNRSRYVPGGITLFLQCAFNPMATASAMLATTFGVRLLGRPSPSLPRLLTLRSASPSIF